MTKSKFNSRSPVILFSLLLITCSTLEALAQRASSGATSAAPRSLGSIGSTAPSAPSTSPAAPQSMVTSPAPSAPPVAPLSPSLPSQFSTGGTIQNGATGQGGLALSPGASPSESAPSKPGGGGKSPTILRTHSPPHRIAALHSGRGRRQRSRSRIRSVGRDWIPRYRASAALRKEARGHKGRRRSRGLGDQLPAHQRSRPGHGWP